MLTWAGSGWPRAHRQTYGHKGGGAANRRSGNAGGHSKARGRSGAATIKLRHYRSADLSEALAALPALYAAWIEAERRKIDGLPARRRETAERLIADMEIARGRILHGIEILSNDKIARTAFRLMNLSVAMAARRRNAGAEGDPSAQPAPEWRPFQLAFILLNLAGLSDRKHSEREIADLLFFPTGGGKTEAYLGLAAFVIAHRRLTGPGLLGAGVAVIMRYTLRLLTLDQLARAAGVVCALELLRSETKNVDEKGRRLLGDWPIEIGLWVGSDFTKRPLTNSRRAARSRTIQRGSISASRRKAAVPSSYFCEHLQPCWPPQRCNLTPNLHLPERILRTPT